MTSGVPISDMLLSSTPMSVAGDQRLAFEVARAPDDGGKGGGSGGGTPRTSFMLSGPPFAFTADGGGESVGLSCASTSTIGAGSTPELEAPPYCTGLIDGGGGGMSGCHPSGPTRGGIGVTCVPAPG